MKSSLIGELSKVETSEASRPLYWEHQGNKAVRRGDWKAVARGLEKWELYNLADDRLVSASTRPITISYGRIGSVARATSAVMRPASS